MRADLLEREAFLRAIFADPDNDMPRLVFADWLDEQGESAWAELIRLQCEIYPLRPSNVEINPVLLEREMALYEELGWDEDDRTVSRGMYCEGTMLPFNVDWLENGEDWFRELASGEYHAWYGARRLFIDHGQIVTKAQLTTLFNNPVTTNVVEFDLSGREIQIPQEIEGIRMFDIEIKPVISRSMVEVLAKMKEARRIRVLDLRNNDLGNDALWALARSPYLIRLEHLYLSEGNRFRGRVWQQVRERFGQDIVE